jgi:hypothetical protein
MTPPSPDRLAAAGGLISITKSGPNPALEIASASSRPARQEWSWLTITTLCGWPWFASSWWSSS